MALSPAQCAALTAAWQHAGRALKIRVVAPFSFHADGQEHHGVAHLPDFGGPAGVVLLAFGASITEADAATRRAAVAAGYQVALINARLYSHFDEEEFIELLSEWDYTGDAATCPPWC